MSINEALLIFAGVLTCYLLGRWVIAMIQLRGMELGQWLRRRKIRRLYRRLSPEARQQFMERLQIRKERNNEDQTQ